MKHPILTFEQQYELMADFNVDTCVSPTMLKAFRDKLSAFDVDRLHEVGERMLVESRISDLKRVIIQGPRSVAGEFDQPFVNFTVTSVLLHVFCWRNPEVEADPFTWRRHRDLKAVVAFLDLNTPWLVAWEGKNGPPPPVSSLRLMVA